MPDDPSRVETYRVLKISPFWKSELEVWILQVEASLRVAGITVDRTKIISSLGNEVIAHIVIYLKLILQSTTYLTVLKSESYMCMRFVLSLACAPY